MTMLNIKTSSDLEEFLKVLAEESVKASRQSLSEDSEQSQFMAALEKDKKLYSQGLHEQEEDEEESAEELMGGEDEEEEVEEEPAEEEEVEEEPAEDLADEKPEDSEPSLKPSFITVRDDINDIRSGTSLKIPDTKQGLETYVGRLSDDERQVLSTFLKAIANIMHGRVTGDDAQDPSDDPVSLGVGASDDSEEGDEEEGGAESSEEEGGEDTSPPIKVGKEEEALKEAFREKVLRLMNS